jgi:hypothetical protein
MLPDEMLSGDGTASHLPPLLLLGWNESKLKDGGSYQILIGKIKRISLNEYPSILNTAVTL